MDDNDTDSRPGTPIYRITPEDEPGRQLLQRYLGRRRNDVTQLKDALARGEYDLIRRIGHNLHGSGAAYDLVRISVLGEQIEVAAERRSASGLSGVIGQLEQFLDSITIADAR